LTVFILVLFSAICLLGIRESSKVALAIMAFHILTILVVAITSIVRWGINGNALLSENWFAAQPPSTADIFKQIFYGMSLAFLGNTGILTHFEMKVNSGRVRVNTRIRRGSSPRGVPQSPPKSMAAVFRSINTDDATCLGSSTLF